MSTSRDGSKKVDLEGEKLKFLKLAQVKRIDELLAQLGEYGELHLIIQKGELRYINKVESYKAWTMDDDVHG